MNWLFDLIDRLRGRKPYSQVRAEREAALHAAVAAIEKLEAQVEELRKEDERLDEEIESLQREKVELETSRGRR